MTLSVIAESKFQNSDEHLQVTGRKSAKFQNPMKDVGGVADASCSDGNV